MHPFLYTEAFTNPNTLGPRVIQISEKFGLTKYVLINVETSQDPYKYHYGCTIISGIQIREGLD